METGSGYFLSFSALTHQIPTVESKRIRCVRPKRSRSLSSLLRLTRKRNVSQAKDKERLY